MTGGPRRTSRLLVIDRQDRALLFLTKAPDSSGIARWLTPGGGVEAGENHQQAAVRELFEETGLVVGSVGAPVWSHDFTVEWDSADHSTGHAEFYRLAVDQFEPSSVNWTDDEKVDVLEHRWWSLAELLATSDPYEPAELPALIAATIKEKL